MDNTPKTESIKRLIDSIEKGDVVLPEFQRDFVWEIGKTYDLFDSLVKDIFIGSVIYGIPSFEITVRELDKRPRKGKGCRRKLAIQSYSKEQVEEKSTIGNFRLVLDGQQRITSMYRALKGIDEVWFIAKNDSELPSDKELNHRSLEELLHEFSGHEDNERLSIRLSDVYQIMEQTYFDEEIKENFFNNLSFVKSLPEEDKKYHFRAYLTLLKRLQVLFNAEKLLSYYLLNTTSEKFSLFFERSNSKGIQLNFIDILAAKLYAGFNLRERIDEFENKYPDFELNREIVVRAISFLVSEGRQIDRAYILSNLNSQHFVTFWPIVCDLYKKSLDFLYNNHFILSQSWMPYQNSLLPLMLFLREIGGDFSRMDEKQHTFIRFWYWASVFAERYSGSSNEIILQDSRILQHVAKNRKITDRAFFHKWKVQIDSPEELLSFTTKGSAIYSGILNLINYRAQGLMDWKNRSKLSFNSKLEDHHIFPKEYIKAKYKNDDDAIELIDSVANRTLIPKITNINIGKKAPSQYLNRLQESNPYIEESLRQHLIPDGTLGGLYDDIYRIFLEERAKSIFDLIKENVIDVKDRNLGGYYQEPSLAKTIKVFATYYEKRIEGEFDLETNQIRYNGQLYPSVSSAASAAKKHITGKETTANGWQFWKYVDDQNQERYIENLRDMSGVNG